MADLVLTTFDWVPEKPRGYVRDIRVRWALEEAGLPYRVGSTPFRARGAEHFSHQPFGQVPWLTDGDVSIFESGAILLHLAWIIHDECRARRKPLTQLSYAAGADFMEFSATKSSDRPFPWSWPASVLSALAPNLTARAARRVPPTRLRG